MPTWVKRTGIIVLSFFFIAIATGIFFHKTDSKFRYWWSLPLENRLLSIDLEVKRPFYSYFFNEINPDTFQHLTTDSLRSAIHLGAQWIVNMQETTGRFNYWYNPESSTYSRKSEDNFLRQAGTGYSLVSAFQLLGDSSLLKASHLSLDYLNRFLVNRGPDTAYYMFKRKAKLGGTALPMLVMLKLKELNNDTIYDQKLKALANMILHLQDTYGSGQYKSTYIYNGSHDYEKNTQWESNIYPGEAMLALAEMYHAFGDNKYLESLKQAVQFYDRDGNWRHFSFMPWAVIAMSKIGIITKDPVFVDFAYKMTDRILYWQNLDANDVSYGSLFGVPTVFTATWMEGVGAALALSKSLGDTEREAIYHQRLMISFNWLLQLQYTKGELKQYGYKQDALGGFRRSLVEPEIRIDNTQHAISALTKAVQYLDLQ